MRGAIRERRTTQGEEQYVEKNNTDRKRNEEVDERNG